MLHTSPLSLWLENIFSNFLGFLFSFLVVSLVTQNHSILRKYTISSFLTCALGVLSRNHCIIQNYGAVSLCFKVLSLALILGFLYIFQLILYMDGKVGFMFLHRDTELCQLHLLKRLFFSHGFIQAPLQKSTDYKCKVFF